LNLPAVPVSLDGIVGRSQGVVVLRRPVAFVAWLISTFVVAGAAAGTAFGATLTWGASPGEHQLESGQPFDLVLEPGPKAVVVQTTTGVAVTCQGGTSSGLEGVFTTGLIARVTNGVGVIAGGTPCASNQGAGSTATVKFDVRPVQAEPTFFLSPGGKPKARLRLAERNTMNLALATSGGEQCEYAATQMKGRWVAEPAAEHFAEIRVLFTHRKLKLVAGNTAFCGKGAYFSATFAYASLSNEGFGAGYQILAET
jgi:hypothetical protein